MEQLMLEELHHSNHKSRELTSLEQSLVICLLKESKIQINLNVNELRVIDMDDGGMGSLYFLSNNKHKHERLFGQSISEKSFDDIDDVEISITLNIDREGELFELDIWRVDSKPLKRYPNC